jgi:16S rRNA (cytosine1402-N4)-methyltransferase
MFKEKAKAGEVTLVTKKPTVPSRAEQKNNPRARSAKLRIARKEE